MTFLNHRTIAAALAALVLSAAPAAADQGSQTGSPIDNVLGCIEQAEAARDAAANRQLMLGIGGQMVRLDLTAHRLHLESCRLRVDEALLEARIKLERWEPLLNTALAAINDSEHVARYIPEDEIGSNLDDLDVALAEVMSDSPHTFTHIWEQVQEAKAAQREVAAESRLIEDALLQARRDEYDGAVALDVAIGDVTPNELLKEVEKGRAAALRVAVEADRLRRELAEAAAALEELRAAVLAECERLSFERCGDEESPIGALVADSAVADD